MLKMGFQEDLEAILDTTPMEKQVLLFSATMPKQIEKIAQNTCVVLRLYELDKGIKEMWMLNISIIMYTPRIDM